MSCFRQLLIGCAMVLLTACGGGGGGGYDNTNTGVTTPVTPTGTNVVPISVNGALGFVNIPYVSVTICAPNTATCTVINNVLIDTGSSGLRLLESTAVTALNLQQRTNASNQLLFECAKFADLSHTWGTVKIADVKIGSNVASATNIQIITNASGVTEPSACGVAADNMATVQQLGANGILGVGSFNEDCGFACVNSNTPGLYYACPGTTCSNTMAALTMQLQNPVARFPSDNTGVIIQFPAVAAGGAASVDGSMIFGIDTQTNNTLGSASKFTLSSLGYIGTHFNNIDYPKSFIDSGSNGYFFPNTVQPPIPTCQTSTDFFCPTATLNLSATISGGTGSATARSVSFSVGNVDQLNANFNAFGNLAGVYTDGFDWGLPFFLGRKVYTAFENNTSGPYIAF